MTRPEAFQREVGPGGLEVRSLPGTERLEARADGEDPMLLGYGSMFDQLATIGGFFYEWDEEVAPGAWTKTIQEGDIRSMFNHSEEWLLGRTKTGTLRLAEDDTGLRYEVDLNPHDSHAMDVHARVVRGDVDGSSVWFRVVREEWTEPTDDNGLERPKRRILEAQLFETGPVVFPAFEQTSVQARSMQVIDSFLRTTHDKPSARARRAADLLADPSAVESEIRTLLARSPELRESVCACETSRAAHEAPGTGTPPERHLPPDYYTARARGLAALCGFDLTKEH